MAALWCIHICMIYEGVWINHVISWCLIGHPSEGFLRKPGSFWASRCTVELFIEIWGVQWNQKERLKNKEKKKKKVRNHQEPATGAFNWNTSFPNSEDAQNVWRVNNDSSTIITHFKTNKQTKKKKQKKRSRLIWQVKLENDSMDTRVLWIHLASIWGPDFEGWWTLYFKTLSLSLCVCVCVCVCVCRRGCLFVLTLSVT